MKKYLFFLQYGGFNSRKRMHDVAKIIKAYSFEKIVMVGAPQSWVMESVNNLAQELVGPVVSSIQADFNYANNREKEGNQTLAFLTRTMMEHEADAIVLVGKGPVVYHTAHGAMAQFLPGISLHGNIHFFTYGDLMVVDIEKKTTAFFKNTE